MNSIGSLCSYTFLSEPAEPSSAAHLLNGSQANMDLDHPLTLLPLHCVTSPQELQVCRCSHPVILHHSLVIVQVAQVPLLSTFPAVYFSPYISVIHFIQQCLKMMWLISVHCLPHSKKAKIDTVLFHVKSSSFRHSASDIFSTNSLMYIYQYRHIKEFQLCKCSHLQYIIFRFRIV